MIDSNQLRLLRQRRTGEPVLPDGLLKNQSRDVILSEAKDLLC